MTKIKPQSARVSGPQSVGPVQPAALPWTNAGRPVGRIRPTNDENPLAHPWGVVWNSNSLFYERRDDWSRIVDSPDRPLLGWYESPTTAVMSRHAYQQLAREHPEAFLRRDVRRLFGPDNLMSYNDAEPDRPCLDPGSPSFREWVVPYLMQLIRGTHADILSLDNWLLGCGHVERETRRAPHWTYAGRPEDWNTAWLELAGLIRDALRTIGRRAAFNVALEPWRVDDAPLWSRLPADAIIMTERFLHPVNLTYTAGGSAWLAELMLYQRLLDEGRALWCCTYPADEHAFWYAYCSWLMIQNERTLFSASRYGLNQSIVPWFDAYELSLGQPKGDHRPLGAIAEIREFKGGCVLVNHSERGWTYDARGMRVGLPPHSGRLLTEHGPAQ